MDEIDNALAPTVAPIAPPQPFGYVVANPETRALVESCFQVPPPEHEGRAIPVDESVRENWTQYRANEGLTGVELIPPTPSSTPSTRQVIAAYMAAVQQHLDATAVRFGYDNVVSVISYAEEPAVPRYQTEGQAFRAWRSLVWAKCEAVLQAVQAGERAAPSYDQLVADLPSVGIEPAADLASTA